MEVYGRLARLARSPLERAEHTLALAEIAYREGEYGRAVSACQKLLQLEYAEEEPDAERPYYLREKALFLSADAHVREGGFAAGRAAAQAGLSEFPEGFYAADFLFLDGMAALQLEEHEAAVGRLQEMLERYPEHESAPLARYYLAYAVFNQTRFEESLERFGEVVRLTPDLEVAPDAAFRIAECHYNLEQYEAAASAYRAVIERYPDSELREDALYNIAWCALNALPAGEKAPDMTPVKEAFSAYLAAYPRGRYVPMAQYTLAEVRFNEGDYDQAYDLFTRIERDFPESEAAVQAQQFIPRLLEALAYRAYAPLAEELDRALDEEDDDQLRQLLPRLEQVWQEFPETASGVGAKLNIGVCYQNLRDWRSAVETFEAIIAAGDEGNEQVTPQVLGFSERRRDMIARRHL
jgi:TolA-binding protein